MGDEVLIWVENPKDPEAAAFAEELRRGGVSVRIHEGAAPPEGRAPLVVWWPASTPKAEGWTLLEELSQSLGLRTAMAVLPRLPDEHPPRRGGPKIALAERSWGAPALAALARLALELARRDTTGAENFIALASHDLRTPVSTLRLVLDLLRKGLAQKTPKGLDIDELLEIMSRNLDRMDAFTTDILDAWRLYRGELEVRAEPVSLNAVVEDVVASMFPAAMQKDIALDFVKDPNAGQILAEERRVAQVAANIIGNAIKYTPRGGAVKVYTRADRALGGCVLEVADTGPGIPESERDGLFRRFWKGSARATGGEPSTGLGLFICKEIVELYGGRIWFESEPGKGARFFVLWPAGTTGAREARTK